MLASTVQFSNNDQPPVTPLENQRVHRGRHWRQPHGRALRHPTTCPAHSPLPSTFHALASSTGRRRRSSVPNNQRSTHEQPASDIRWCTGLWTTLRLPRSAP